MTGAAGEVAAEQQVEVEIDIPDVLSQPDAKMTKQQAMLLRTKFHPDEVGKLPRSNCKKCSDDRKPCGERKDNSGNPKHVMVWNCKECGGNHTSATIHLDFVGHAAATDRMLQVDYTWTWEPLAFQANGLPQLDPNGGMWIKLTIGGVTRLGYGDAQGKTGPNAIKEVIGDALRNAGMRFGIALDLWRKSERHEAKLEADVPPPVEPTGQIIGHGDFRVTRDEWAAKIAKAEGVRPFDAARELLAAMWQQAKGVPEMVTMVNEAGARLKALMEAEAQKQVEADEQAAADAEATAQAEASVAHQAAEPDEVGPPEGETNPADNPPPVRPHPVAGSQEDKQMHHNTNEAVKAWWDRKHPKSDPPTAEQSGIVQARGRWRARFDKAKQGKTSGAMVVLERETRRNGWDDYRELVAQAQWSMLLDQGIAEKNVELLTKLYQQATVANRDDDEWGNVWDELMSDCEKALDALEAADGND